jgi:hypothetical protein
VEKSEQLMDVRDEVRVCLRRRSDCHVSIWSPLNTLVRREILQIYCAMKMAL